MKRVIIIGGMMLALCASFCGGGAMAKEMTVPKPGIKPINQSCRASQETLGSGMASWYGAELHGQQTADGGRFNMLALTAAHRTLPFGTRVQVKNRRNGKMIVVKITDRGPYAQGRIIDLSKEAARKLSYVANGTAAVEIRRCLSRAAYEQEEAQRKIPKKQDKKKVRKAYPATNE